LNLTEQDVLQSLRVTIEGEIHLTQQCSLDVFSTKAPRVEGDGLDPIRSGLTFAVLSEVVLKIFEIDPLNGAFPGAPFS